MSRNRCELGMEQCARETQLPPCQAAFFCSRFLRVLYLRLPLKVESLTPGPRNPKGSLSAES